MRAALALLTLALAAGRAATVDFFVIAAPGTTVSIELIGSDGGVVWSRGSLPREKGAVMVQAQGWAKSRTPVLARLRVEDGGCTALAPIGIRDGGRDLRAAAFADGGCALHHFPSSIAEYFKNPRGELKLRPSEAGDFPPYTPPHVHGSESKQNK